MDVTNYFFHKWLKQIIKKKFKYKSGFTGRYYDFLEV